MINGRLQAVSLDPKSDKKKLYKLFALLLVFLGAYIFFSTFTASAAGESEKSQVEIDIENRVKEQLGSLNTEDLQRFIDSLSEDEYALFGGTSFMEVMTDIISGDFKSGYGNFFSAAFGLIFKNALNLLPMLTAIAVIAVLSGILGHLRSGAFNKSTGDVIFFVCYGVVILLMMNGVRELVSVAGGAVASMRAQMNLFFPILLTLMIGLGGSASASVYQPAVGLLATGVTEIISNVILPLFIIVIVFSVVGNLSSSVRLGKMTDFFKSSSTWIVGIVFTVFVSFLTIKGITAASYDGISIRAAKFATKSYIPILGGYLTDGFDLILASTVLMKNAAGLVGVYLLIATILVPVIQILVFKLGLKLVAAVTEPIADKRISDFTHGIGKNITMLIVAVLAVGFMYLITTMLIIITGNNII